MPGHRERKRRQTFAAIHEAGMDLFARHGYAHVTVGDVAEAAGVSRATVFAYYPAKEDIVLGEAPLALDSLRTALAEAPADASAIAVVRDWLRTLVGWMEPDIVLQRRLAEEVPAVAAARSRVMRDAVEAIAEAVADEVGPGDRLLARMVAGALGSAIAAAEEEAAQRMSQSGRALGDDEVEALLDAAMAFVEGGIASVRREN